jgi:hypothetical protein
MKITVDDFVLAEMSGPVGVRDFKISSGREIEEAQFLRADAAAFFDRKNQRTIIAFSVTRLHASIRDAEVFLLAHETDVPSGGLVTFTALGNDGQEVSRYLADAIVQVTEASYIGLSTRVGYSIKGGLLLSQRPA